jgi:hypothetical protein
VHIQYAVISADTHGQHVHDGGTHLALLVDGKMICDSIATYGGGAGESAVPGMAPPGAGGHGHESSGNAKDHITSMSTCFGDKLGLTQLKKGQKWQLEAYYDYDK